ncbi:hypothetical protein GCM10018966_094650 [Streptomyces yanii]
MLPTQPCGYEHDRPAAPMRSGSRAVTARAGGALRARPPVIAAGPARTFCAHRCPVPGEKKKEGGLPCRGFVLPLRTLAGVEELRALRSRDAGATSWLVRAGPSAAPGRVRV